MKESKVFIDKVLRCCDCGESFVFTAGEQGYYHSKGLTQMRRCKPCRELRKRTLSYRWGGGGNDKP